MINWIQPLQWQQQLIITDHFTMLSIYFSFSPLDPRKEEHYESHNLPKVTQLVCAKAWIWNQNYLTLKQLIMLMALNQAEEFGVWNSEMGQKLSRITQNPQLSEVLVAIKVCHLDNLSLTIKMCYLKIKKNRSNFKNCKLNSKINYQ